MRDIEREKKSLPDIIYLIPEDDYWAWCDDPAPDSDCIETDAVTYVKLESYKKRIDELMQELDDVKMQYLADSEIIEE
tara:strand:- start:2638 stop:2871 length:234 start_codon:yes stop_codon:yes gene_type:complete